MWTFARRSATPSQLPSGAESGSFDSLARRMIDPLLKGLNHTDVKVRRVVSQVFEWTGPRARRDDETISALIKAPADRDPEVRENAAVALRACEARALRAVPALHRACKDPDADVQSMARNAIDVIVQ